MSRKVQTLFEELFQPFRVRQPIFEPIAFKYNDSTLTNSTANSSFLCKLFVYSLFALCLRAREQESASKLDATSTSSAL